MDNAEIRDRNRRSNIIFQDPTDGPSLRQQNNSVSNSTTSARATKSALAVVLLAGGYGERITEEIKQFKSTLNRDSRRASVLNGLTRSVVSGSLGKERICQGLLPINAFAVLDYYISALSKVERIAPFHKQLYIVCNEIDRHFFLGQEGYLQKIQGISPIGPDQVISNGTNSAEEWQGDVQDLARALEVIGMDIPVLAISTQIMFIPEYPFQRVIEHSMIRAKDVIGFNSLRHADIELMGTESHSVVELKEGNQVPQLAAIRLGAPADEGTLVAEPLVLLRPNTLRQVCGSSASSLVEFASELLAGGDEVCGIDLQWGRFNIHTVTCIDYVDNYLFSRYQAHGNGMLPPGHDHMMVLGTDTTPLGVSTLKPPQDLLTKDLPPLTPDATAAFDKTFFGSRDVQDRGLGPHYYKLPPTFYRSTYKRQCETGLGSTLPRK